MNGRRGGNTGGALAAAILSLAATLALPSAAPAQAELVPGSPVEHFRIYGFDKENGWRSWQLEGARAELEKAGTIRVDGLRLRVFEADSNQTVNLTIESPLAVMNKSHDAVSGPGTIVVTAKGIFLGGEDWTWTPDNRKLHIRTKTHAVLDGELCPILE